MKIQSFNVLLVLFSFVAIFESALSQPPNDTVINVSSTILTNHTETKENDTAERRNVVMKVKTNTKPSVVSKLYFTMMNPIKSILEAPKVNSVMKNIATCVVNGAVELISYYFPAPLIPIIASAAGMMIPFEPVLMLRDKMPVTSYRRAFMTALNSFLGKFDRYKLPDNDEYDPYMTQRFNRRMMSYGGKAAWVPSEATPSKPNVGESRKENKGNILASIDRLFATLDRLRRQGDEDDTEEDPGTRYRRKKEKPVN